MKKTTMRIGIAILVIILSVFTFAGCGDSGSNSDPQAKVKIGLSWMENIDMEEHGEDLQAYIDAVEKAGAEPVLLPLIANEDEAKEAVKSADAIIMTGGEDIDPARYGEKPDKKLEDVNKERDTNDFLLLDAAINKDMPVLATCRGLQVLNVLQGGTLYQDIPTQYKTEILHRSVDEEEFEFHQIIIATGTFIDQIMETTELDANSWHHQCIKKLGAGLTVTATSNDKVIEAIELDDASFVLGVQFHPEWHVDEGQPEYIAFFKRLIEEASKGNV